MKFKIKITIYFLLFRVHVLNTSITLTFHFSLFLKHNKSKLQRIQYSKQLEEQRPNFQTQIFITRVNILQSWGDPKSFHNIYFKQNKIQCFIYVVLIGRATYSHQSDGNSVNYQNFNLKFYPHVFKNIYSRETQIFFSKFSGLPP